MCRISRREMIQAVAAAAAVPTASLYANAGALSPAASRRVSDRIVPEAVRERFQSLPLESQEIGGLFAERMRINVEGRLLHVDEGALLSGFADRDAKGDPSRAWEGEHAGKFLDAACDALRYRDSPSLRRILHRIAKGLIASQEVDGYLGTYAADRRWTGWDVWVHKYNLIGLLNYYETTGDPTALAVCRRMGDLLDRVFGDVPGKRDIVAAGEHMGMAATSILEPICKLYRVAGEARYLEFAKYIVRAAERPHGPRILSSLWEHGSVYRTANGKAYEMLSNLNGVVDLYRITADEKLLSAVMRAWEDIVRHQLYFTGTASAREHFQPIGQLLSLQSSNVGETCVTVTWAQLNLRLLRLTGEPRFAQQLERTVYNHLLAAQNPWNGDVCYYTSLAGTKEYIDELMCCVSSGPRGLAMLPKLVWGLQENAFVINFYTSGRASFEIDGVPVQVLSQTQFPLDGEVALTVNPQRATVFSVRLRVPEWTTHFEVSFGSQTLVGKPGEMLDITRTWNPLGTLTIRMDMPTRILQGTPTYPDYVALQRGPQILALDKAANPTIPYLQRVGPADAAIAKAVAAPPGWTGGQLYEVEGLAGVPHAGDRLRLEKRKLLLVPFADATDYRVWLMRAAGQRSDIPAVTAFSRAKHSELNPRLQPGNSDYAANDIAEFLTDENPRTFCTVDPRYPTLASVYLGGPAGKRGDPVWFVVMLDNPQTISRVVFRHGALSAAGGWFDSSAGKPYIEVARSLIPLWENIPFLSIVEQGDWEKLAAVDQYPQANALTPPRLTDGQAFEVRLSQPTTVYAVRIVGKPGGDYASCAELSAYA